MPAVKLCTNDARRRKFKAAASAALVMRGWTQGHFARLIGWNDNKVSRIMNDPLSARTDDVLLMMDKLKIPADVFDV